MGKDGEVDVSRIRANERIAWHNGRYVPESQVLIPFRDRGVIYGDAVFDTTRSFGHRLFKVREHLDRLYRSLRYLRLDPGLSPAELAGITEEVFERNLHLLGPDEDYWISQRITRGLTKGIDSPFEQDGPTVIVECLTLPLRQRSRHFRDGIRVVTPPSRRTPPEALSPRAKTHNYLNLIQAEQEVRSLDPEAWAVLLDTSGNLCEGQGSNIFLVRDGELLTPRERFVLPGISRQTVIDHARQLESPVPRGRPRPLRRAHRRRGLPHLDQPVHLPRDHHQRPAHRPSRPGLRPRHPAPGRCLSPVRRPRFRGPVPQAPAGRRSKSR